MVRVADYCRRRGTIRDGSPLQLHWAATMARFRECGLGRWTSGCAIARSDRLRCSGRADLPATCRRRAIESCAPTIPSSCASKCSSRTAGGRRGSEPGRSASNRIRVPGSCDGYLTEPKSPVASDPSRPRRIRWLDGVARYAAVDASPLSSSCLKRRRSSAT